MVSRCLPGPSLSRSHPDAEGMPQTDVKGARQKGWARLREATVQFNRHVSVYS